MATNFNDIPVNVSRWALREENKKITARVIATGSYKGIFI